MRTIDNPPGASALLQSSRDIGYTMPTALADIVDNSLAAEASAIGVHSDAETLSVAIIDDGYGMTQDELVVAMRYASKDSREERDIKDLGRFGLGLKLASLSQCQQLTVVSRKDGKTASAIWDQAEVDLTDKWSLGILDSPEEIEGVPFVGQLGETGTLVLWQKLDLLEEIEDVEIRQNQFNRRLHECRQHLELTCHRYLSGEETDLTKCEMAINGNALAAHDPFRSKDVATQIGPVERIGPGVECRVFTLPQQSKSEPDDWKIYGRAEGYLKTQGFYIYRQKRLIIQGDWMGIARQREITKLTRVRVDISNNLDREWNISLDKSRARFPAHIEGQFRNLFNNITTPSKRVVKGKGKKLWAHSPHQFWNRYPVKESIHSYLIAREHPVVREFEKNLSKGHRKKFNELLRMIELSIPVEAIYSDRADNGITFFEETKKNEVVGPLITMFDALLKANEEDLDITVAMISGIEPFMNNWDLCRDLLVKMERIPDRE